MRHIANIAHLIGELFLCLRFEMIKITSGLESFFYQLNLDGYEIPTVSGFDCYYADNYLIYRKIAGGLTFEIRLHVDDIDQCQCDDFYNIRHVLFRQFSKAYAGHLARDI